MAGSRPNRSTSVALGLVWGGLALFGAMASDEYEVTGRLVRSRSARSTGGDFAVEARAQGEASRASLGELVVARRSDGGRTVEGVGCSCFGGGAGLVFADGFESGGLGEWTGQAP